MTNLSDSIVIIIIIVVIVIVIVVVVVAIVVVSIIKNVTVTGPQELEFPRRILHLR